MVWLAIDEIERYPGNPRRNADAVAAVARSIDEFGWQQPLVIDRDHVIVAGDTRYQAALALGLEAVPCVVADLAPEKARAYRLADNRTAELSEWDDEKLRGELEALIAEGTALASSGFEEWELEQLTAALESEPKGSGAAEVLLEQSVQLTPPKEYVLIVCEDEGEFEAVRAALGLGLVRRGGYKEGSAFDATGVARCATARTVLEVLGGADRDPE